MEDQVPRFIDTAHAAKLLGLSESTLEKMRHFRRPGPPVTRIGRAVRYDRNALLNWATSLQESPK